MILLVVRWLYCMYDFHIYNSILMMIIIMIYRNMTGMITKRKKSYWSKTWLNCKPNNENCSKISAVNQTISNVLESGLWHRFSTFIRPASFMPLPFIHLFFIFIPLFYKYFLVFLWFISFIFWKLLRKFDHFSESYSSMTFIIEIHSKDLQNAIETMSVINCKPIVEFKCMNFQDQQQSPL